MSGFEEMEHFMTKGDTISTGERFDIPELGVVEVIEIQKVQVVGEDNTVVSWLGRKVEG